MIAGAQCKKCRRANQKLFLKGDRCYSQKCAMVRRAYIPGVHGKSRGRKQSEFGQQLAEKQKMKRAYCLSESQFLKYFKNIVGQSGDKEEFLIQQLERRLDNVVFRLGWAKSRSTSRQIVGHGHIKINGRRIDIPSYQVKVGDKLEIRSKIQESSLFDHLRVKKEQSNIPGWLVLGKSKFEAEIKGEPKIGDCERIAEINKVIEFYSR